MFQCSGPGFSAPLIKLLATITHYVGCYVFQLISLLFLTCSLCIGATCFLCKLSKIVPENRLHSNQFEEIDCKCALTIGHLDILIDLCSIGIDHFFKASITSLYITPCTSNILNSIVVKVHTMHGICVDFRSTSTPSSRSHLDKRITHHSNATSIIIDSSCHIHAFDCHSVVHLTGT